MKNQFIFFLLVIFLISSCNSKEILEPISTMDITTTWSVTPTSINNFSNEFIEKPISTPTPVLLNSDENVIQFNLDLLIEYSIHLEQLSNNIKSNNLNSLYDTAASLNEITEMFIYNNNLDSNYYNVYFLFNNIEILSSTIFDEIKYSNYESTDILNYIEQIKGNINQIQLLLNINQ